MHFHGNRSQPPVLYILLQDCKDMYDYNADDNYDADYFDHANADGSLLWTTSILVAKNLAVLPGQNVTASRDFGARLSQRIDWPVASGHRR